MNSISLQRGTFCIHSILSFKENLSTSKCYEFHECHVLKSGYSALTSVPGNFLFLLLHALCRFPKYSLAINFHVNFFQNQQWAYESMPCLLSNMRLPCQVVRKLINGKTIDFSYMSLAWLSLAVCVLYTPCKFVLSLEVFGGSMICPCHNSW